MPLNKWDFWNHSNALQAFVRMIKEHPQLHLKMAEIETDLYRQEILEEICSDEYNGFVSLVGVTSGEYKKSWKPGMTTEFRQDKFNQLPFVYHMDMGSRTFVIDDSPDYTEVLLYLYTPALSICLRVRFLHQIFDDVLRWFAALPVKLEVKSHRRENRLPFIQEPFERMKEIFEEVKLKGELGC